VVDGSIGDDMTAALIRPDGYLAWSANEYAKDSSDELATTLTSWFGPAHPPTR